MVIIRDPITRLLSEYGHYYATETYWGRPAVSFEERVYNHKTKEFRTAQILKVGDYSPHFEHLLKVFPRNQVRIEPKRVCVCLMEGEQICDHCDLLELICTLV